LLADLDHQGLLNEDGPNREALASLSDDDLLAELDGVQDADDIRVLKHVSSREERRAAEEIANRSRCEDFEKFKPLFDRAESGLQSGLLETRTYGQDTSIVEGDFFIVGGQIAYVAEVGETIKAPNGESDARLRVIYSNGTESNLLRRSLQRALYKDDAGRRLVDVSGPNLFSGEAPHYPQPHRDPEGDASAPSLFSLRPSGESAPRSTPKVRPRKAPHPTDA